MRNVYWKYPTGKLGHAVTAAILFGLIAWIWIGSAHAHSYLDGAYFEGDVNHDGYRDVLSFEQEVVTETGEVLEQGIYMLNGVDQSRSEQPIIPADDVREIWFVDDINAGGAYIGIDEGDGGVYSHEWYNWSYSNKQWEASESPPECHGEYVHGSCEYNQGNDEGIAEPLVGCVQGDESDCYANPVYLWQHSGTMGPVTIRVWYDGGVNPYSWETTLNMISVCGPEETSWMDPRYEYKICNGDAAAFISPTCQDPSANCGPNHRILGYFSVQAFQGGSPVGELRVQWFQR